MVSGEITVPIPPNMRPRPPSCVDRKIHRLTIAKDKLEERCIIDCWEFELLRGNINDLAPGAVCSCSGIALVHIGNGAIDTEFAREFRILCALPRTYRPACLRCPAYLCRRAYHFRLCICRRWIILCSNEIRPDDEDDNDDAAYQYFHIHIVSLCF